MKKSSMLFLIVFLFALLSISAVNATTDFDDATDVHTLETDTDEILTTDDHANGEGYIDFDSDVATIREGNPDGNNITGTLYYSEGEYNWEDVNVNCNYTDGNNVERSYVTTIKDSELNFDLSQCEGLIASDTPYKLTFSPIADEYYDLFLAYNDNGKLADSYILLTVTNIEEHTPNEIYVGTDGTDAEGYGSLENPYKTIAYAVSKAQANDIIYINEGRYNENSITLNKTLTLIGLNRNVVIYSDKTAQGQKIFEDTNKGADSYKFVNLTFESISFGSNSYVFNLQNTGVSEITNCTFNDLTLRVIINSLSSENRIYNCQFNNIGINQAMTGTALYLGGTSLIKDTTFTNSLNKATMSYVNLIQTAASTKLDVDNLTIDGTTGKYNLFYVNKDTQTTIKNSKIINNDVKSQSTAMGGMLFYATGSNATFNVNNSVIANNTPQNGFFYGISNTMTFNMNNNVIYNNTGKIMVNANPIYNIDYNYWGENEIPTGVTINNWIIVEASYPDAVFDNELFTVTATLKVNDSEGNINELENPIGEVPVTFEYNNQKVDKVISDKSTETTFTFDKASEDIIVTAINEKIAGKISEKELRVYVAPNGTDAEGYGTKARPYKTIKYAVSKAEPNYTVCVYEGRYDENSITLNNNITILGENKNVVITSTLDNRKIFESVYNENGNNISLRFENLTFDTIKPGMYNAILNLRSEGKTEIINCLFENTDGQYNIWSASPETLIENCEFKNIGFTTAGNLIYLTGKGTPKIVNTKFNKITSTANGVVSLISVYNKPTTATIDNLTVSEVSGKFYGINLNNNGYGDINNSITIKNSKLENNNFEKTNNNQGGSLFIASSSSKLEITNSTIAENKAARGIFAGTSNETEIIANNNLIYNNTADILFSTGNPVTKYNLEYNYWGSEDPDLGDLNIHIIAIDKDLSEMKTVKNPIDPIMDVEVNTTINVGENLTIKVTLNDDAIGTITITGIEGIEPQTLKDGKTTFTIENLKENQYPITISYSGSLDYKAKEYETTITVKNPKTVIPGGEDALNMTTPEGSDSPSFSIKLPEEAEGYLTVTVNGTPYTQELVNGSATVNVPKLSPGKYNITVSYSGDDNYEAISKTMIVNVPIKTTPEKPVTPESKKKATKKVATKITAKKKTFKAKKKVKKYTITLKAGKKPVKKVWVTLKIKGKKLLKAKTNAKGKATFKIKKLTKKGKYKATIKFKGNKNYKASSKKVKITIK